jgi:hypothetical protein
MKNYIKSLGLLIMLIFSCKQEMKNKAFINKLSSVQNGLPSPYFNYYLYFKMDNNKILETNIDLVYEMYKVYYSQEYSDFNIYLEKILNGKEIIKSEYAVALKNKGDFLVNISDVDNNTEKMSTEDIGKNYLNLEQDDTFILKTGSIEPIKVKTILYRMFIKNYIITFSDYGGYYNIKKYKELDFK